MKLKSIRYVSAPIATAIYQLMRANGIAVITSISTCCFTMTVDRIIKNESIITGNFIVKGKFLAVSAARMKSMDKEQCKEGMQLSILLSLE